MHLLGVNGLEGPVPDVTKELLRLGLEGLEGLPPALMRIEVDKGLYDLAGQLRIVGHSRVAVHVGAVALEHALEPREAIAGPLGHRVVKG